MPPKLQELSFNDYLAIKKGGMFWEYYPEATGIYYEDVQQPNQDICEDMQHHVPAHHPPTGPVIWYEDTQGLQQSQNKPKEDDLSNTKYQWTKDGLACKAVIKDNTIKIKAVSGYCNATGTLLKLKDTGNGFIAKFHSYSSVEQDNYLCLDYDEADYLYKALHIYCKEQPQDKEPERDSCNW